jgi:hypothetical protein
MKTTQNPHGIPGHVNIYTLDHDSKITGRGCHARVIAYQPSGSGFMARVDLCWPDLREPSTKEVLKAAKADQGIPGRWIVDPKNPPIRYDGGRGFECIEYTFIRA